MYLPEKSTSVGFAAKEQWSAAIDLQSDFVIVEDIDKTTEERCRRWKEKGYAVFISVSLSRCTFPEYLDGRYDDINHSGEVQTDAEGNPVLYGPNNPYMVPTVDYIMFLYSRLTPCIDAAVDGIVLTEPDFSVNAGYSEAFRSEWERYYHRPWQTVNETVSLSYKTARLKALLFERAVFMLGNMLKNYAASRSNITKISRPLQIYLQIKGVFGSMRTGTVSPSGTLTACAYVDGFFAKSNMKTHRRSIICNGVKNNKSFETAFLDYSYFGELIVSSDKQLWLPQAPRDDEITFSWDDYAAVFKQNLVASVMAFKVNKYVFCNNPSRIFDRQTRKIPKDYASVLEVCLCALRRISGDRCRWEGSDDNAIGIIIGDTAMYQRSYPRNDAYNTSYGEDIEYMSAFYGLAMPFVEKGINVRPLPAEQICRVYDYLNDYNVLIMSYEYFKPADPELHYALNAWVRSGGVLIYMGDSSDTFSTADEWWKSGRRSYPTPLPHLLETLGVTRLRTSRRRVESVDFMTQRPTAEMLFEVGKGIFGYIPANPVLAAREPDYRDLLRRVLFSACEKMGIAFGEKDYFSLYRSEFRAVKVLEGGKPHTVKGLLVDLFSPELEVETEFTVPSGGCGFYYDIDARRDDDLSIIAIGANVEEYTVQQRGIAFLARSPVGVTCLCRLFFPNTCEVRVNGETVRISRDKSGKTVFFKFEGSADGVRVSAVRIK